MHLGSLHQWWLGSRLGLMSTNGSELVFTNIHWSEAREHRCEVTASRRSSTQPEVCLSETYFSAFPFILNQTKPLVKISNLYSSYLKYLPDCFPAQKHQNLCKSLELAGSTPPYFDQFRLELRDL